MLGNFRWIQIEFNFYPVMGNRRIGNFQKTQLNWAWWQELWIAFQAIMNISFTICKPVFRQIMDKFLGYVISMTSYSINIMTLCNRMLGNFRSVQIKYYSRIYSNHWGPPLRLRSDCKLLFSSVSAFFRSMRPSFIIPSEMSSIFVSRSEPSPR